MPGSLKYFSSKPNFIRKSRWVGKGYYYNRGRGRWTKYSRLRDIKLGSRTTVGRGRMKQTHDRRR